MFRLVTIEDTVQVPPALFGALTHSEAIELMVNRKYADKVLSNIGVCVRLFDFAAEFGDAVLMPVSGDMNVRCVFRVVVFAPMAGEVLWGWVNRNSEAGSSIDLEFVGGVTVPVKELPGTGRFEDVGGVRVWQMVMDNEGEEGEKEGEEKVDEEKVENALDEGNQVMFRVMKVVFTEGLDKPPDDPSDGKKLAPVMEIEGSMRGSGLGRFEWWEDNEEAEEGGEEGEEDEEGEEGGEYEGGGAGGELGLEASGELVEAKVEDEL